MASCLEGLIAAHIVDPSHWGTGSLCPETHQRGPESSWKYQSKRMQSKQNSLTVPWYSSLMHIIDNCHCHGKLVMAKGVLQKLFPTFSFFSVQVEFDWFFNDMTKVSARDNVKPQTHCKVLLLHACVSAVSEAEDGYQKKRKRKRWELRIMLLFHHLHDIKIQRIWRNLCVHGTWMEISFESPSQYIPLPELQQHASADVYGLF